MAIQATEAGPGGDYPDRSVEMASGPLLSSPHKFKLAVFSFNNHGGTTYTQADDALQVTWDQTKRLAEAIDRSDIEGIIPIARWKQAIYREPEIERIWETFTAAAAIAAITGRVQVFATFHLPLVHPVMAAKMIATVDHISGGRFALNVVAGWNQPDFDMYGIEQLEHDERYVAADEWMQLLKQIWTEREPFDFDGTYYQGRAIVSEPKPIQSPHPLIMSAGFSPAGQQFARKHADLNFLAVQDVATASQLVADAKEKARAERGHELQLFCGGWVICRDTEEEAREYYDYIVRERGDWKLAEATLGEMMPQTRSLESMQLETLAERYIAGTFGVPFIGTPEQVVAGMKELSDAGLDGIAISWVDYDEGIRQYQETLRPLMIEAGLREG